MTGGSVVATDNIGNVHHQYVKVEFGPDGAGTPVSESNPLPVVSSAGTIAAGTIGTVTAVGKINNAGTIAGGTVQINTKPTKTLLTIGSAWGTTSGTAGTLVSAPGASNSLFINDISIINQGTSTLEAGMSFGTSQQGTTNIARGIFGGNGGVEKSFQIPIGGAISNAPIVMWTNGSGTASFNVTYWTEAT